jgi:diguanylate cyclase (GGDEF)-like protein
LTGLIILRNGAKLLFRATDGSMPEMTPGDRSKQASAETAKPSRHQVTRWSLVVTVLVTFVLFLTLPSVDFIKTSDYSFTSAMHVMFESFAVMVSLLIFAVAYNSHGPERPGNAVVLACGFLAVGLLDFAHMLSFKDMPLWVTPPSEQKSIAFWMSARLAGAITLFLVVLRPWTPFRNRSTPRLLLAASLAATLMVYWLVLYHLDALPPLFIPGQGLTTLKVAGEYGVIGLLLITLALLSSDAQRPKHFDVGNLLMAILLSILSELCFTIYSNINDVFSMFGHLYKVAAFCFLYHGVFVSSVREPFLRLSDEMRMRRDIEARIEFLAYHDTLTGLPNRVLARELFTKATATADRTKTRLAVMFLDIDNFKTVNDSLGHAAGDALLRAVAEKLRAMVRRSDMLCRQGGDEFLLVLSDVKDLAVLPPLCDKIIEQMRSPISFEGSELSVSVSMGIAIYPDNGGEFEQLMRQADAAMYRAKDSGRDRYAFYDPATLENPT